MFLWLKLGAVGAALIAGYIAWQAHDAAVASAAVADIQTEIAQIGEAAARREAEMERVGARMAQEQAAAAGKRLHDAESKLATAALGRRALFDELAARDAAFASWRDSVVPRAAVAGLRERAVSVGGEANHSELPAHVHADAGAVAQHQQ